MKGRLGARTSVTRQKQCLEPAQPRLESVDLSLFAVNRLLLLLDRFLLRLRRSVLLLDLVQEQRVDQVIANSLGPAVAIVDDEIRIDVSHLLGDQAVLGQSRRIDLRLVSEGDRPQLHQAVALTGDLPDVFLDAARGGHGAELTASVYEDADALAAGCPADSGNEGRRLDSRCPDPDRAGLGRDSGVADADVVAPDREVEARIEADPDVVGAFGVPEGADSDRCVGVARRVAEERGTSGG